MKYVAGRLFTAFLYMLAIVGGSSWDADPDSWFRIVLRLVSATGFLVWAVTRTVGHWHQDAREDS